MLDFIRFHFYQFNLPINKKIDNKYFFPYIIMKEMTLYMYQENNSKFI